jgi:hypothetical protein
VSASKRDAEKENEQKSIRNRYRDTGHWIKEETNNIKDEYSIGCFIRTNT